MIGMILMGLVFFYALCGCILLYAWITRKDDPNEAPSRKRLEALIDRAKRG